MHGPVRRSSHLRSGNDGSIVNQGQLNDSGTSVLGGTSTGASIFSPSSLVFANFQAVPEPTTWLLLALGLIPLWRRRA